MSLSLSCWERSNRAYAGAWDGWFMQEVAASSHLKQCSVKTCSPREECVTVSNVWPHVAQAAAEAGRIEGFFTCTRVCVLSLNFFLFMWESLWRKWPCWFLIPPPPPKKREIHAGRKQNRIRKELLSLQLVETLATAPEIPFSAPLTPQASAAPAEHLG